MSKKKVLSMQQLLRASKMNLRDRRTLSYIAKEFDCSRQVLKRNLDENNINYTTRNRSKIPKKKRTNVSLKDFLNGLESNENIKEIRDKFKKDMYISVAFKDSDKNCYRINGNVKIKDIYSSFMLIQKKIQGTLIRESISFRDIYTNDVEVEICEK